MTTEFERCKQAVLGRSVMITSWFDDEVKTWRAGAPTYAFVRNLSQSDSSGHTTRKAAIDRVLSLLTNRFRSDETEKVHVREMR